MIGHCHGSIYANEKRLVLKTLKQLSYRNQFIIKIDNNFNYISITVYIGVNKLKLTCVPHLKFSSKYATKLKIFSRTLFINLKKIIIN